MAVDPAKAKRKQIEEHLKGQGYGTNQSGDYFPLPVVGGAIPGTGVGGQGEGEQVEMLTFVKDNLDVLEMILHYMREIETLMTNTPTRAPSETGTTDASYAFSDDVSKAVQSEFGLLGNPLTKLAFLAKLAGHSLLVHQPSDSRRYPIVLCIDCSGSMGGRGSGSRRGPRTFYVLALAFVLAVMKRLHRDNRGAAVIQFDHKVQQVIVMSEKKPFNLIGLLKSLSNPTNGGTSFDPPLLKAFEIKKEQGWNSVVAMLVSDGYGSITRLEELNGKKSKADKIVAAIVSQHSTMSGVDELFNISAKGNVLDFVKIANSVI